MMYSMQSTHPESIGRCSMNDAELLQQQNKILLAIRRELRQQGAVMDKHTKYLSNLNAAGCLVAIVIILGGLSSCIVLLLGGVV